MKITQAIIDDWSGPDGYCDLAKETFQERNNDHNLLNKLYLYEGGLALVQYNGLGEPLQYAIEATKGWRGKLKLVPRWMPDPNFIIDVIEAQAAAKLPMPDPEFSLEEISAAQELMEHQRD